MVGSAGNRATVIALGGREYSDTGTVQSIAVEEVFDAWRRLPERGVSLSTAIEPTHRSVADDSSRIAA
jgi:hypothetical protein